jgi:glycine cleavage system H protein
MTAGLLAYKLCDREYDCEHCALDAAMSGSEPRQEAENGCAQTEFRRDRRYHATHCWVSEVGERRVRCGVDAFAAGLLNHATTVVFPPARSRLLQGQAGCWIVVDVGLVPIRSPVSGTIVRSNDSLHSDPGLMMRKPYDEGWLFEAALEKGLDEQGGLIDAEKMRGLAETQTRRLRRRAHRRTAELQSSIGQTLADGGEPLADLPRILGARQYRRLILRLLS